MSISKSTCGGDSVISNDVEHVVTSGSFQQFVITYVNSYFTVWRASTECMKYSMLMHHCVSSNAICNAYWDAWNGWSKHTIACLLNKVHRKSSAREGELIFTFLPVSSIIMTITKMALTVVLSLLCRCSWTRSNVKLRRWTAKFSMEHCYMHPKSYFWSSWDHFSGRRDEQKWFDCFQFLWGGYWEYNPLRLVRL